MHHHALGLVDHQQAVVLIDDVQGDFLRQGVAGLCVGNLHQHLLPRSHLAVFGGGAAVHRHAPLGDEPGGGRTGHVQRLGQKDVQPAGCGQGGGQDFFSHASSPCSTGA